MGVNARVLANRDTRGWTRYTAELLRALSRRSDIKLTLFAREPLDSSHLTGITAQTIYVTGGGETSWSEYYLPKAIARAGVDVFHAPADRGIPLFRAPCPMIVTLHNSFERAHWKELYVGLKARAWYWKNELANYSRADCLVTVSETAADEIVSSRIARRNKLTVIYPAQGAEFTPEIDQTDTLLRATLPSRFFLYVGGYDRHKNVNAIAQAFDSAHLTDSHLVIVARRTAPFAELVDQWKSLASFDRMHFLELAPAQLPAAYRAALAFINASEWESFSFQILEAFATGCPLATSSRGAMPEIAGNAAILFDPSDIAELTRIMISLSGDKKLRDELRQKGLRRAEAFSWDRTATETAALYRRAAGTG